MAKKLTAEFDWRGSAAHMRLLEMFLKPKEIQRIEWIESSLKESSLNAIDRMRAEGALIECDILEKAQAKLRQGVLKEMAKARGLKTSGTNAELIERLRDGAPTDLSAAVSKYNLVKCAPASALLIEQHRAKKEEAKLKALSDSHAHLLKGDAKSAYATQLAFERAFDNPDLESSSYLVENLYDLLNANSEVFKDLKPELLNQLRAATAMKQLWHQVSATDYLPGDFNPNCGSAERATKLLERTAHFLRDLMNHKEWLEKVKLVFDENDVDLCEECLTFNNRVFATTEVPTFPRAECSNPFGCVPHIRSEEDDDGAAIEGSRDFLEEGLTDDPVETLRKLKQMLTEGLIEEAEYREKKKEVLARM